MKTLELILALSLSACGPEYQTNCDLGIPSEDMIKVEYILEGEEAYARNNYKLKYKEGRHKIELKKRKPKNYKINYDIKIALAYCK